MCSMPRKPRKPASDTKRPSNLGPPTVAVIGRPNVGKSSLFNKLAGSRVAIEDAAPGTTRDRLSFLLRVKQSGRDSDRIVELIDAAGIGAPDESPLDADIAGQIQFAIDAADVLVFVVNAKEGCLPLDREIAARLRRTGKPIVLAVNKVDVPHQEQLAVDFHAFGLGDPITTSARENRGLDDLRDAILERLPPRRESENERAPVMRLAIVGKRNSGKSSLVNWLAHGERVIVSEIPGTTRDSVDVHFSWQGMEFMAIDTAGLQRERSMRNSVEFFSQSRSLRAIRRADVVVLLMDSVEQTSRLDRKLVEECLREVKPVIIAVNKWDLVVQEKGEKQADAMMVRYRKYIATKLSALRFAPIVFMSVKEGLNCAAAIELALDLHRQAHMRAGTGELNRAIQDAFDRLKPRARFGKVPKLFYAVQVEVAPPAILVFVNDTRLFRQDWRDYLKGQLRARFTFGEIPLKIIFKNRERVDLKAK